MADTPFFSWAEDEPSNRLQPPQDIQNTGIVSGEPVARVWLNYMFNRIFKRIEPAVDDIVTVSSNLTNAQIATKYGGVSANWEYIGNEVLSGGSAGTVYFYKRVS